VRADSYGSFAAAQRRLRSCSHRVDDDLDVALVEHLDDDRLHFIPQQSIQSAADTRHRDQLHAVRDDVRAHRDEGTLEIR
jgi:hypothetical protein